ncbi:MAG: SGNH/GDSL hydrolase family protein [Mycoplasmoidaceae bacterium]|nr:SGNH/GDSL hydrolase family protein [Mycoplasmoidaceae bacterium]
MKTKNISLLLIPSALIIFPITNICVSCNDKYVVDMSAFGDSLTMLSNYNQYVGEILHFRHTKNYGICGSTIAEVPTQSPFVDRYKEIHNTSKIIAIDGGYNDCSFKVPIGTIDDTNSDTFYGALNILLDGVQNEYKSSYIFFITPFYYDDYRAAELQPYIEAIRLECIKFKIDCMDIFSPDFDFDFRRDTEDGIHPTLEYSKNT